MGFDKLPEADIIKLLACPSCRGDLIEGNKSFTCRKCKRILPIKEGILRAMPDNK